ncbi:MAG TPA: hypothetical protein PKD03_01895 [Ignavibacteriaceae bacterium]|nr:hypothetical protein [Ignavibacteriaceae bacterium]
MYKEFLQPIFDYFTIIRRDEFLFEWITPIVLSFILILWGFKSISIEIVKEFNGYIINFLAILIGFSITCITILVGSESDSIKTLKEKHCQRSIEKREITLYQLILISFSYAIIIEIVTLAYVLIFILVCDPTISVDGNITSNNTYRYLTIGTVFLLFHIILLNLRNITNFYFVFWRNKS